MPTLLVRRSHATGPTRRLKLSRKAVLVGRSPNCTICLKDPTVSRLHCVITQNKGSTWQLVRDKSASSLRVNGAEINSLPLHGGESIEVGGFTIVYDASDAASRDESEPCPVVAAAQQDLPHAALRVQTGPQAGHITQLTKDITVIGRGEMADLVLSDRHCSRSHAEIHRVDGAYQLHDLGSMNGAFVNDIRVIGDQTLRPGDIVTIGRSRLAFVVDGVGDDSSASTDEHTTRLQAKQFSKAPAHQRPRRRISLTRTAGLLVFGVPAVLLAATLFVPRDMAIEWIYARPRADDATQTATGSDRDPKLGQPAAAVDVSSMPVEAGGATSKEPPPSADQRLATSRRSPQSAVGRPPVTAPADDGSGTGIGAGTIASALAIATEDGAFNPAVPLQPSAGEAVANAPGASGGTNKESESQTPRPGLPASTTANTASQPVNGLNDTDGLSLSRLAVPDEDAVAAATKTVQAAYADDLAATPTAPTLIASLIEAAEQSSRPASKYALLIVAEQVALRDRAFQQLATVIDARGRMFDIDTLEIRLAALRAAVSTAADQAPDLFEVVVETVREAVRSERFDVATRAVTLASQMASFLDLESQRRGALRQPAPGSKMAAGGRHLASHDNAGESTTSESVVHRLRHAVSEGKSLQRRYATAVATLAVDPNDAKSHEVVGKYLCFVRDDWRAGLAALAVGRDPELKSLAARELALVSTDIVGASQSSAEFVAEVIAVAEAWWTFADWHKRSPDLPSWAGPASQSHAAQLYLTVVDMIEDPVEARLARQRIAAAESVPTAIRRNADSRP